MKHTKKMGLAALWLASMLLPFSASADNHTEESDAERLADIWVVHAKEGHEDQFEDGLKAHIAHRKSANDPRTWHVYTPVIGQDLGYYVIRSCCHTWADLDSYRSWAMNSDIGSHFDENVGPHTAGTYTHVLSEIDTERSRWPDDVGNPALVGVTYLYPKPGRYGNINRSLDEFIGYVDKANWERPVSFAWTIGGKPTLTIASPFKNYADMKDPDPTFFEMVAEQVGGPEEAEKRFKSWNDNFHGSNYVVFRHRTDLGGSDSGSGNN